MYYLFKKTEKQPIAILLSKLSPQNHKMTRGYFFTPHFFTPHVSRLRLHFVSVAESQRRLLCREAKGQRSSPYEARANKKLTLPKYEFN